MAQGNPMPLKVQRLSVKRRTLHNKFTTQDRLDLTPLINGISNMSGMAIISIHHNFRIEDLCQITGCLYESL